MSAMTDRGTVALLLAGELIAILWIFYWGAAVHSTALRGSVEKHRSYVLCLCQEGIWGWTP